MFEFWSKTTISFSFPKLSNIVLIHAVPAWLAPTTTILLIEKILPLILFTLQL